MPGLPTSTAATEVGDPIHVLPHGTIRDPLFGVIEIMTPASEVPSLFVGLLLFLDAGAAPSVRTTSSSASVGWRSGRGGHGRHPCPCAWSRWTTGGQGCMPGVLGSPDAWFVGTPASLRAADASGGLAPLRLPPALVGVAGGCGRRLQRPRIDVAPQHASLCDRDAPETSSGHQ